MRLSDPQIRTIHDAISGEFGPLAEVILFGSRVDDSAKGGDIDLMVTLSESTDRPSLRGAHLAALLERKMEGRHVDVVLVTPETPLGPIHAAARQHGVRL
uniref:Nucleotidyltransferase domain-containing protein n=1 Tax=Candidatus Kentrum sp. FM TaxID=2126340 RepID=A0A450WLM7_9GAMM|nr:MAG: Nucleotidyltransferase domain-containing protein [Candidatus Kentron sp. FM]VFJ58775.1 MAG: Nucleotidyltransferase domain-containing protein [Candidatus Kentron sp. FM]VFK17953.1 MAG: Nucleotidyltransferase domain-containing protein [Candidatus Kentron sp. FM]